MALLNVLAVFFLFAWKVFTTGNEGYRYEGMTPPFPGTKYEQTYDVDLCKESTNVKEPELYFKRQSGGKIRCSCKDEAGTSVEGQWSMTFKNSHEVPESITVKSGRTGVEAEIKSFSISAHQGMISCHLKRDGARQSSRVDMTLRGEADMSRLPSNTERCPDDDMIPCYNDGYCYRIKDGLNLPFCVCQAGYYGRSCQEYSPLGVVDVSDVPEKHSIINSQEKSAVMMNTLLILCLFGSLAVISMAIFFFAKRKKKRAPKVSTVSTRQRMLSISSAFSWCTDDRISYLTQFSSYAKLSDSSTMIPSSAWADKRGEVRRQYSVGAGPPADAFSVDDPLVDQSERLEGISELCSLKAPVGRSRSVPYSNRYRRRMSLRDSSVGSEVSVFSNDSYCSTCPSDVFDRGSGCGLQSPGAASNSVSFQSELSFVQAAA